jgi:hypothetical protein
LSRLRDFTRTWYRQSAIIIEKEILPLHVYPILSRKKPTLDLSSAFYHSAF